MATERTEAAALAVKLLNEIGRDLVIQIQAEGQNRKRAAFPAKSTLLESFSFERDGFQAIEIFGVDYVKYVEAGRRPGARRVPIRALLAWLDKYKARLGFVPSNQVDRTNLAFAIQNAIFRRGLRPRPFVERGVTNAVKVVDPFASVFAEDVANLITRNFE